MQLDDALAIASDAVSDDPNEDEQALAVLADAIERVLALCDRADYLAAAEVSAAINGTTEPAPRPEPHDPET